MRIVLLTPGAAGMFCGGCMRDNALTAALRRGGHDALQIPLYTPLNLDETDQSQARVFFGGVNVYLQQKSRFFAKLPEWISRRLDSPEFLKFATSFGVKTDPAQLGEMTLSMLQGEDGKQARELDKLAEWMREHWRPDVVLLSNALMAGMAKRLHTDLEVPIVCTLQGEDYFLDQMLPEWREKAWSVLRERAKHIDAFIAVSRYFADTMAQRLNVARVRVHAVHNGIDLSDYASAPASPADPTIVYLARMAPEKGLKLLVEAFAILKRDAVHASTRLRIGGSMTGNDIAFVQAVKTQLEQAKLTDAVEFLPNLSKPEKIALLQSGSVFCVPAEYGESFGLYVLEALACGVPVVEPRHGPFPEILAETGGGVLYEAGSAQSLARELGAMLSDSARAARLGAEGRERVLARYSADRMAADVAEVLERVAGGGKTDAFTATIRP